MNAETKTTLAGATVKRTDLLAALRLASLVIQRRNTIPILGHVILTGSAAGIEVRSTNLKAEYVGHIDGAAHDDFRVTAHGNDLMRLVSHLPDEDVQLGRDGAILTVQAGRTSAKFWGMEPEDMPAMAMGDLPHRFDVPAEALAALIGRVSHAISTEETRYYLNGIFLQGDGQGGINAVATDGHRMALAGMPAPEGATLPPKGVILPRMDLAPLCAMLAGLRDGVSLAFSETRAQVRTSRGMLTVKLIDETYPDYRRVLPEWSDAGKVMMKRADLAGALSRVGAASWRERSSPLKFSPQAEGFELSARHLQEVQIAERVAAIGQMPSREFVVNIHYLRAMLGQVAGDVEMHSVDYMGPIRFHDTADPRAVFVIMPMRI